MNDPANSLDRRESRRLSLRLRMIVQPSPQPAAAGDPVLAALADDLQRALDRIGDAAVGSALLLLRQLQQLEAAGTEGRLTLEDNPITLSADAIDFRSPKTWAAGTPLLLALLLPDTDGDTERATLCCCVQAEVLRSEPHARGFQIIARFASAPKLPLQAIRRFLLTYPPT